MAAPKGNKFGLGLTTTGKKPMFKTPKELEIKCIEYFDYCTSNNEKPTITGLTLYVGFSHRASWNRYLKKKAFVYIVKRSKLTVEHSYELCGTTFDIFALKNMGWKDKTEVDNKVKIKGTTIKWGKGKITI